MADTNIGGIPKTVEDGVSGVLVTIGDAEAAEDPVKDLICSPKLRKYGDSGTFARTEKFSADETAKKITDIHSKPT